MDKIIRVFPRKTKATPKDDLVRINEYPGFFDEADEVHISVELILELWDNLHIGGIPMTITDLLSKQTNLKANNCSRLCLASR